MFQTTDSGNITIEDDILLPKLVFIEIHGNNPSQIYITDKMFKFLKNIKYINIQNVSLDKLTLDSNKPAPTIDDDIYRKENLYAFNKVVPILPTYMHKKKSNIRKNKLIFMQPKDVEFVSYETYKKTKRGAKTNKLFSNNKHLLFIRISNCGLKDISNELFDGLNLLETLILDNNVIEYIPDFSFYGASMLKSLSLANNKIKQLQVTSLGGLLDLKYLNLQNNALTVLSETTFPPLPKLTVADLSNNPIETVYSHTFEVLNATTELTLGSNDTQLHLHQNSFLGLDSLEVLNLINLNVLVLERNLFIGLPNLIELDIKGTITHIAFDAFVEVPNIKRLKLSYCSIQSVSMDSFYGIYNLEHLDLSNNQLYELPPGLFDQQFSLKELILNNNKLSSLPEGIFKAIPNVLLIRLDKNPLHCACHMESWDVSLMTKSIKPNKISCEINHVKKGYNCSMKKSTTYIYNKKVEPICSSPPKFNGKTVSHVVRKYLNCNNKSYGIKSNFYMEKKYKELKNFRLLSDLEVKPSIPKNKTTLLSSKLDITLFSTKSYDIISTNKSSFKNKTNIAPNLTSKMVDEILEPINIERNVLLNNGTYISKSLFKEKILKMTRKNNVKNTDFQIQKEE